MQPSLPEIYMDGNILPDHSSFRLLGLPFANDLSWRNYFLTIAKAAAIKLGSLYRAKQFLSVVAILLYKSSIRPCFEY